MFVTKDPRPIFVNKPRKSAELTEILRRTHCKVRLEIIQTDFKKCWIYNTLNGTEGDDVRGAEEACEASDEDNFSGSCDEDVTYGID